MYNRLTIKQASNDADNYQTRLNEQNKKYDLHNDGSKNSDKMLEDVRDNKEIIDTTEVQMDAVREADSDAPIVESALKDSPHRDNSLDGTTVKPLDVLNAAQEQERVAAFKKARKEQDTAFWDKYMGVDKVGDEKKQISRMGPSQLHNNPDRFSKLSTDPAEISKTKVKDMVTASMKDADTILLTVFYKAASENRELNAEEQAIVNGVTSDKIRLLTVAQADPNHVASRIEQLESLLSRTPVTSPEHDRMKEELDQLVGAARNMTQPQGAMVQPFVR